MSGIFISYRREDSAAFAGRLFDRLRLHFGTDRVFRDVASIPAGSAFARIIEEQIQSYEVFLVVIGPGWLDASDERARRRLELPDDLVAAEINAALRGQKLVIPVLVEDQRMVTAEELPERLQGLAQINAIAVSDARFDHDVGRLIDAIEKCLPSRVATLRKRLLIAALGALAVVAILAGLLRFAAIEDRPPIVDIDSAVLTPSGQFAYLYRGPGLELSEPNRRWTRPVSDLAVLEDEVALCPWTDDNGLVQNEGRGHFNHWLCEPVDDPSDPTSPGCETPDEYLIFSTSDNSSPAENGRRYALTLKSRLGADHCRNRRSVVIRPEDIYDDTENSAHGAHAFVYRGPGANHTAPGVDDPTSSNLELLEDGSPLRWSPSVADIARQGQGRYIHIFDGREGYLVFSASDNSDPRTNGRLYAVTVAIPEP